MSRDDATRRGAAPEGAPGGAPNGVPVGGDADAGVDAADWRGLVAAGRFVQARTVIRVAGASGEEVSAVEVLAEIQELAREKAWPRALGRLERLAELRALVDLERLQRELRTLQDASRQIDIREAGAALATLDALADPYLEAEAATQRGTAHVLLDDPASAREAFEHALEVDPRHYRAITNLGNLALENGEVDAAIAAYEAAIRIDDGFANAHHNLGVALRRKGNVGRSVRSLRRAQKAMQQREADRARDAAKGLPVARILRWLLIAGVVVAVYIVLSRQGIL